MALIDRIRKQKAVWWPEVRKDQHGRPVYGQPVVIRCRWQDCREEFIDMKGSQTISQAKVYVDRDTKTGVLWNSGLRFTATDQEVLDLLTDPNNPMLNPGAAIIRKFDNLPNLRATKFLKTAML